MTETVLAQTLDIETDPNHIKKLSGWIGRFVLDLPAPGQIVEQHDWTRLVYEAETKDGRKIKLVGRVTWETAEDK